jgi:3-oxoacyl-[acyl-carrier-protein] synthase II
MSSQAKEPARVVVTGVGAVTAQGISADAFWEGVKSGRVAIREVKKVPMDGYRTRIAGEVQEEVRPSHDYTRPEDHRDPVIDFALKAAEEALEKSRVRVDAIPAERWGVVMGTCNAGLLSGEKWYQAGMRGEKADPRLILLVTPQALAEAIGGAFGLKGPVLSVDTACAAGANAIGYAAELVRYGQADAVLTGGSDALSDVLIAGFNSLESLSPKPAAPYSKNRQGLSLGEGSGMLVLMREDLARKLGLPVLAEVVGYGLSADGYHATAPHPEGKGASRAIRAALSAAGLAPEQVGYVNSHGTGTPKNDPAETRATKLGLGPAVEKVAVSSTKSMIGHLLGAAGAVEGIITVKALEHQIAPPTANYEERDPECDLDYVPNTARPLSMDVAISNNFAFGGANASVVLARGGSLAAAPPRPDFDRVVVSGLATLTSAGCEADGVWKAFAENRNTTKLENGTRIGRVELDPSPFLKPKDRRRMDRLGVFAVVGSQLVLRDAALELSDENRNRVGVIFGTGVGPMESMENFSRPLLEEGPLAANPAIFPNTVYNAAGGQVAMHVGAIGPASTVTAGHAAGASAICYGYDLASCAQADALICLAADTLTDTVIRAYRELGLLATEPASSEEGGFALAEAGIALLLERASKAEARGARIYGEVLGYGIASDGRGVGKFDREGQGLERAMRLALERSGLRPGDVKAIWSGLAGYRPADMAEQAAVRRLFGASAPPLLAPKALMGEPMGAGGALAAALAFKAWQHGGPGAPAAGPVLVNSGSLGGTHFCLALAPYSARKGTA